MTATKPVNTLDMAAIVRDPNIRVVVTCGSGGVGKTTTAAAMAVIGAEAGRKTVVLTIDPARRLAQSMGLTELDNTPRTVKGVGTDSSSGGQLFAMMLDMKRTFDEVIIKNSDKEKADRIFANPFYQSLSSSLAGTQEYMAMEKLGQLAAQNEWDLIVVDTPPSRSALDFLDAPNRLSRFLDGRMVRFLSGPGGVGGKVYGKMVTVGVGMVAKTFSRVIGGELLGDLSTFVTALDSTFRGFRERSQRTYDMLTQPGTAFVVVASPEPDALREASYFIERLSEERMPLAGVIVNRTHTAVPVEGAKAMTAARAEVAADNADARGPDAALAAVALRVHAEIASAAEHDARMTKRFSAAHPHVPLVGVPALSADVHDLAGLRTIGDLLGA